MGRSKPKFGDTPFIRISELPPLHPNDAARALENLVQKYDAINNAGQEARRKRLLSWQHLAP